MDIAIIVFAIIAFTRIPTIAGVFARWAVNIAGAFARWAVNIAGAFARWAVIRSHMMAIY